MGALFSVGASGCLASHPPTDPIALEDFCDAFFEALCGPIEACECSLAAQTACRQEQRELCLGFPSAALVRAVEEGRTIYHVDAASALVRRMRERGERCEGFVATLDWQVRDLFSLGGVLEGTLGAGEACEVLGFELISECALGSCAPLGDGYACRASVGLGERCGPLHQCVDLEASLTPERGIDRLALRCVEDAPGSVDGTCARWVDDGGACGGDADCWSGRCEASRCTSGAVGEPCLGSRECQSGHCASVDHTCQPGDGSVGARCDDDAACASHVCLGGECLPAGCGTF